jgi:hypothetical protein
MGRPPHTRAFSLCNPSLAKGAVRSLWDEHCLHKKREKHPLLSMTRQRYPLRLHYGFSPACLYDGPIG